MKPIITGVTVSVDIGDKDYGKGESCFMNIQGRYPDSGQPIEEIIDVITDGLDMYFAAWRALLAGRFATGKITSEEFKDTLAAVTLRVDKTRKYLRNHDGRQEQQ
jgi:hypothetical protein